MHSLLPGNGYGQVKRKVNVLAFMTAKVGPEVLPHLLQCSDISLKVVSDCPKEEFEEYLEHDTDIKNLHWIANDPVDAYRNQKEMTGHKLAKWADMLFIIGDAGMISLTLANLTSDVILHTLRCWDISKRVLMLPELSKQQHNNPIWKEQICNLQKRFEWIQMLRPALWDIYFSGESAQPERLDERPMLKWNWDGETELMEVLQSETQTVLRKARGKTFSSKMSSKSALPAEIWTLVFDHLGDWETATALDMYTHISVPTKWHGLIPVEGSRQQSLEWMILTKPISKIRQFFESQPQDQPPKLSAISLDLIFRFARTDVLTYLALHQKDVFWTSFPSTVLPHKASCIYNSTTILQWWKECPAIIQRDYEAAAIDGASRAGFIEVLQWWLDSGLPLVYTERALENASSRGLVEVLEWWKTSCQKLAESPKGNEPRRDLPLRVGKSIWLAAQCGRVNSIAWWERSGIAYSHEERVATVASQGGHVEVLDLWYGLKGSKMIFDNQVLVGPTKHGHANVLEWWKDASRKWKLRVEYKTCDIEEAMEDAVGGGGEGEVREWWARNGLNLGVGTGEWMKVKTL